MSRAKDKGRRGENEAANWWRGWFEYADRRVLTGQRDRGDITGLPLTVQVKRCESWSIPLWLRQLEEQVENNERPGVLQVRRNRGPWVFVLPEETMRKLLDRAYRE